MGLTKGTEAFGNCALELIDGITKDDEPFYGSGVSERSVDDWCLSKNDNQEIPTADRKARVTA